MSIDVSELSPEERRVILVTSEGPEEAIASSMLPMLKAFSTVILTVLPGGPLFAFLIDMGTEKHSTGKYTKVGLKNANSIFCFDAGHPQNMTAYVQSPCNPNHYIVPALANQRFVQEKVATFVELVAALGARKLKLVSAHVRDKQVDAAADIKKAANQAGLNVRFNSNNEFDQQVIMEFPPPSAAAAVPAHVEQWMTMEPIWRMLASTRLQQRAHSASVSLQLREASDVAAKLCATLPGAGFSVGGKYVHVYESTWAFEVEFWPLETTGTGTQQE